MIKVIGKYWHLLVMASLYATLGILAPHKATLALEIALRTVYSVALIIFSVFILIGLVNTWLNEDLIASKLGHGSGTKAIVFSALFGSFLAGPLFAIFPLLKSLMNRGARIGVIIAMLTTWSVKIPMLPLEVKFLGFEFAALRVLLVLMLAVPMSLLIEKFLSLPKTAIYPEQEEDVLARP